MVELCDVIEIENFDTLFEYLEYKSGAKFLENSFLDLSEPKIMDDFNYRQMQRESKKYGYAIKDDVPYKIDAIRKALTNFQNKGV